MLARRARTAAVIAAVASIALLLSAAPAAADGEDKERGGITDFWSANTNGTTHIGGTQRTPGSPNSSGAHRDRANGIAKVTVGREPPPPSPFENCLVDWDSYRGCWQNSIPGEDAEVKEGEESPGLPPITITDLASFSPAKGTILGEPDNLGVAGLPTNFVTEASQHVRSGELFGFPIDVRFTPVSYTFHYGDGESQSTSSPGTSWESLGQAQFTPTDTSHTYSERGTYDARVDIAYTAEIDLGVGWFPIDGQLDIAGPAQQIRIFEAHTALVARTCAEQPSAPGC